MPSPIGHALAGIAAAWTVDLVPGDRAWRTAPAQAPFYVRAGDGLTLLCAGLGAAPDLDLAFAVHRTMTHSITAVVIVGLVAGGVAAFFHEAAKTRRTWPNVFRITLMCSAAYGSHLLLDWLGVDNYPPRGIQALWPFSQAWYISEVDLFRQTARLRIFTRGPMLTNVRAILQELAILAPVVGALWFVRVKALAGLAPQLSRRDHPAQ